MDSVNKIYNTRQWDEMSSMARYMKAAKKYHKRGLPLDGEELFVSIDLMLTKLREERTRDLARILVKLEYMFGREEGWENQAHNYVQSNEGKEWVIQQLIRVDELRSGSVRPSGSGDREKQTINPDRNSDVQRSDSETSTVSQESSQISLVSETNFFEQVQSSSAMTKAVAAGATLLAGVFLWQHYIRS